MNNYKLSDFLPLIVIAVVVLALTLTRSFVMDDWAIRFLMRNFMAFFFLIFGSFKVMNLHGFAKAYQEYDLLAKQSLAYAYAYPFIELGLGLAYLFNVMPVLTNVITFFVMAISALGVFNELRKGKQIVCACLGVVFKIPMTYVTLTEDLLMAGMALAMLFIK